MQLNRKFWTSLIMVLTVLLVLSSTTLAWVSLNRQAEASNYTMKIQSVSDLATVNCWALKYDGMYGAVCYAITDSSNEVAMTEFDNIFRDRNVNTPLIYVLEIANVPDEEGDYLLIRVPCTQDYIKDSNSGNFGTDTVLTYISNVISVKVGCSDEITAPEPTTTERVANNVTLFNTEVKYFANITSGDQYGEFVTLTEDGDTLVSYSKNDELTVKLSRSVYTSKLYEAETDGVTSNHLVLYIEFDYSEDMMDAFSEHMPASGNDGQTTFANDLGTIQISVGQE